MAVRSKLPLDELKARLEEWATTKVGHKARVVGPMSVPEANGMIAPTVLFDLAWDDDAAVERLVLKGEADFDHVPETYGLSVEQQARLQSALAGGPIPVAPVRWTEDDPSWIGIPFFVMDRLDGVVAPDRPPYTMAGWVLEAAPEARRAIELGAVDLLARIHCVDVTQLTDVLGPAVTARVELDRLRPYYEWARRGRRSDLVDGLFEWCEENLPEVESDAVLCWGDARLGNLLHRGVEPVAVLDWDAAGVRPREFDLGWMIVFHGMFQEVARRFGGPGLPDMFDRAATITAYERAAGVSLGPIAFHEAFAALKIAVATFRSHGIELYGLDPDGPLDDLLAHRQMIEKMLTGEYWR